MCVWGGADEHRALLHMGERRDTRKWKDTLLLLLEGSQVVQRPLYMVHPKVP